MDKETDGQTSLNILTLIVKKEIDSMGRGLSNGRSYTLNQSLRFSRDDMKTAGRLIYTLGNLYQDNILEGLMMSYTALEYTYSYTDKHANHIYNRAILAARSDLLIAMGIRVVEIEREGLFHDGK